MLRINAATELFGVPRVVFTCAGNPKSEEVIADLRNEHGNNGQIYEVLDSDEAVKKMFESGLSPLSAVVLYDTVGGGKHFSMTMQTRADDARGMPRWSYGAQWGVRVHAHCDPRRCSRQLRADFYRNFTHQFERGHLPWGLPRKKESLPSSVRLPGDVHDTIRKLNEGPNLAAAIADKECAVELPQGSRISWTRVPAEPIGCDERRLTRIMNAVQLFEQASHKLVERNARVREVLFAGVELDRASPVAEAYLSPASDCFSVSRLDLHYTGNGLFASENDEMPGGFAELVHLDAVYGINQERWERAFEWLTSKGLLLFIVSHDWSKVYIPELEWLTAYLTAKGYPVAMVTTDNLDELAIGDTVCYAGEQVGTVWRQFPVFETKGKLADLVLFANQGGVRLVPEFAHFGNKAWFSLYRQYNAFYKSALTDCHFKEYEDLPFYLPAAMVNPYAYDDLEEILPDSHLVISRESFPCVVAGGTIESIDGLRDLAEPLRDKIVLKICGANELSARSYGVLMGHGLTTETWRAWIDERLRLGQPFIVQRRLETAIAKVPVMNTARNCAEQFHCRMLLRPWRIGSELVSVSACAVPSNTLRVHGRVDMAILPVVLE